MIRSTYCNSVIFTRPLQSRPVVLISPPFPFPSLPPSLPSSPPPPPSPHSSSPMTLSSTFHPSPFSVRLPLPRPSPLSSCSSFISRRVFVELWPRVAANEHPNCTFGLPGSFCETAFGAAGAHTREAQTHNLGGPWPRPATIPRETSEREKHCENEAGGKITLKFGPSSLRAPLCLGLRDNPPTTTTLDECVFGWKCILSEVRREAKVFRAHAVPHGLCDNQVSTLPNCCGRPGIGGPWKKRADELKLRREEEESLLRLIDTTNVGDNGWTPLLLEEDWHAICQTICIGIEEPEWEVTYYEHVEMHTMVKKARALWLLKVVKENGGNNYDPNRAASVRRAVEVAYEKPHSRVGRGRDQVWPRPSLARTKFGQDQGWPRPRLAKTKFGQTIVVVVVVVLLCCCRRRRRCCCVVWCVLLPKP